MNSFIAIVLVCAKTLSIEACDEASAADVRSVRVANELGCASGWQEIIARSDGQSGVGETTYLKTLCKRVKEKS